MAEIKLNLREPNSEKETPINLIIRFNNQKLVYSSGKRILPKYWEILQQKSKKSKDNPNAELLNANLRSIVESIRTEIETYLKIHNQIYPDVKELKALLDVKFGRTAPIPKKTFFEFINWFSYEYAPYKQIATNSETNVISKNTIKTYTTTLSF
jgi:hypothetical protein